MESLFTQHAPKRGRLVLMLVGSLVIHGGWVGIGALFVQPPPKVDVDWLPPGDGDPNPPARPPEIIPPVEMNPEPTAKPDVIEPEFLAPLAPADVPDFVEPSKPSPHQQRTAVKPAVARTNSAVRSNFSAPSVPGSGTIGVPSGNTAAGTSAVPWVMPHPPYPAFLRNSPSVSVTVRITTDAAGQVSNVAVARSTGNAALDAYTVSRVRGTWHGPANSSRVTEFTYQLR